LLPTNEKDNYTSRTNDGVHGNKATVYDDHRYYNYKHKTMQKTLGHTQLL